MLSFLCVFPNLDLLLKSCHLLFPASSSFFALIFLNFLTGASSAPLPDSAAACCSCACGYKLAAADSTTPLSLLLLPCCGGGGAGLDDDVATGVPSAFRFCAAPVLGAAAAADGGGGAATGRMSRARSVSTVS